MHVQRECTKVLQAFTCLVSIMHLPCIHDALPMYPICIHNVFIMHPLCIHYVSIMYPICIHYALPMHTRTHLQHKRAGIGIELHTWMQTHRYPQPKHTQNKNKNKNSKSNQDLTSEVGRSWATCIFFCLHILRCTHYWCGNM